MIASTEVDERAMLREIDFVFHTAIRSGLWFWFEKILPGHFKRGANVKYKYAQRNSRYIKAKIIKGKREGRTLPDLVWSGHTRDTAVAAPLRPPRVMNTHNGYRGQIVVNLPAYISKNRHIPGMNREVSQVNTADWQAIYAVMSRVLRSAFTWDTKAVRINRAG